QIGRKRSMSADVGEHGQGSGGDHSAADREAIESVSQVNGVARANDDHANENHEGEKGQRPEVCIMSPALNDKVGAELLDERDDQLGGVQAMLLHGNESYGDQQAGEDLQTELGARCQAEIAALHHLDIVVGEADGSEGTRCQDRQPHKYIAQIRPQESRHHDGDGNQQPAHGGRACFLLMGFRPFFADILADLEVAQPIDYKRAYDQAGEERGEAGEGSAERKITEDTKWREIVVELDEQQPVKQSASEKPVVSP